MIDNLYFCDAVNRSIKSLTFVAMEQNLNNGSEQLLLKYCFIVHLLLLLMLKISSLMAICKQTNPFTFTSTLQHQKQQRQQQQILQLY